jgi:hypothetical protein
MPGLIDDESIVMNLYERCKQFVKLSPPGNCFKANKSPFNDQNHSSFFPFSSSTRFLSSSMDLFAGVSMGLLNESFNADIQREFPPLVAPRAIAYMTKFAITMSRIMINNPMAAWFVSIGMPFKESCEG